MLYEQTEAIIYMKLIENDEIIKDEKLVESKKLELLQAVDDLKPRHRKSLIDEEKSRLSIYLLIFSGIGFLAVIGYKAYTHPEFVAETIFEAILLFSFLGAIHGIADIFIKEGFLNDILKKNQQALEPTKNEIKDINEKIYQLGNEKYLSSLKPNVQAQIKESLQNIITIHELRDKENIRNAGFRNVTAKLISNESSILKQLAVGKLEVSSDLTVFIQRILSEIYSSRFDAVSSNDLEFWLKPEQSSAYLKINENSIERRGTIVTRIFIISLKDIKSRLEEITSILLQQSELGIAWGVAIEEEVDDIKSKGLTLDFALFDKGHAISIFHTSKTRKFLAIFLTKENNQEINDFKRNHRDLIIECSIVNTIFKEQYKGSLSAKENDYVSNKLVQKIKTINQKYQPDKIADEKDLFIKIANDEKEIKAALSFLDSYISNKKLKPH